MVHFVRVRQFQIFLDNYSPLGVRYRAPYGAINLNLVFIYTLIYVSTHKAAGGILHGTTSKVLLGQFVEKIFLFFFLFPGKKGLYSTRQRLTHLIFYVL